jgi:hypothetical protein
MWIPAKKAAHFLNQSCHSLHPDFSTQYLDAVKVLPLLFKPMQKKLQATKTNLQNGIDQATLFIHMDKIKSMQFVNINGLLKPRCLPS